MARVRRMITPVAVGAVITMSVACGSATTTEPSGTLIGPKVRPSELVEASVTMDVAPTSTAPHESAMAETRTAFEWLMNRRIECGRRPRQCVVDELAVPGSPVHQALSDVMADRVRYGIVASDRGTHRFRIDEIRPVASDEVTVRVCHSDDVVLTMAVAAGRPGAIYDESWSSHWAIWTMKSIDGRWRWTDESVERRVYEEELCDS